MNAVKLVAVFAENKPGQTARVTRILAHANLNIRWVTIASVGAFGVMKFLVDNAQLAYEALKHEGYVTTLLEVLAVEVSDQPGALHAVRSLRRGVQIWGGGGGVTRIDLGFRISDLRFEISNFRTGTRCTLRSTDAG